MTDIRSYKDLPIVCRALRRINLTMKYACGFQEGATVPTKRQELDADQKIEKTLDTVHVDFVSGKYQNYSFTSFEVQMKNGNLKLFLSCAFR